MVRLGLSRWPANHRIENLPLYIHDGAMEPLFVLLPIVTTQAGTVADPSGASGRRIVVVEADGDVALALFTEQELAVRFAHNLGFSNFQLGWFDDPIDLGYFLQLQQRQGCTHVCIDAEGIGESAVVLSIDKTLVSISKAILASA